MIDLDQGVCIRCDDAPALDDIGYCGYCHWAVRAELAEGMYSLREYLSRWAAFRDWEAAQENGEKPAEPAGFTPGG